MGNDPQTTKGDKNNNGAVAGGSNENDGVKGDTKTQTRASGVVFKSRYPRLTLYLKSPQYVNGKKQEPGQVVRFTNGTVVATPKEAAAMRKLDSFGRMFDEVAA